MHVRAFMRVCMLASQERGEYKRTMKTSEGGSMHVRVYVPVAIITNQRREVRDGGIGQRRPAFREVRGAREER
jgi:hypothetical protein